MATWIVLWLLIISLIAQIMNFLKTFALHVTRFLYHLLPPYRTSDLRLRSHPFQLPEYDTDLHKKSFIFRTLYEYIK